MSIDLLNAVRTGTAELEWVPLRIERDGWTLTLVTLRDAIRVDGVRRRASARTTQLIADLLGALLPTPRIVDERWRHGVRLRPVFRVDGEIAAEATDERYSAMVDAALEMTGGPGPIEPVGKHWVITRQAAGRHGGRYGVETAYNYGWHSREAWVTGNVVTPGLGRLRVAQGIGGRHNLDHADPSQNVAGLVGRQGWLRGPDLDAAVDLTEIAADPQLCGLVCHDGPIESWRYPTPEVLPMMASPLRAGAVIHA